MYKSAICFLPFLLTVLFTHTQPGKYRFTETKMGSPFHIILIDGDSAKAAAIARNSFQLVDSFNRIFSDYDTTSELSKLNAQAGIRPVKLSPALWDMILQSKKAYELSKGVFDITVAPLSTVWRKARKNNQFPDENLIKSTRRLIGFSKLVLDSLEHSVYLPVRGMRLDLGGIAKGYTAEKLVRFIRNNGIQKCLVDAGGDMVMGEAAANSGGWTIGVNIPETTDELLPDKLQLQNRSVATSGDAFQYIEHNGKKYSHIINPLTGYGITSQRNVTVIADNGTLADWLATAASILPLSAAKKLAESLHASLLITEIEKGKIVSYQTSDFGDYWKK